MVILYTFAESRKPGTLVAELRHADLQKMKPKREGQQFEYVSEAAAAAAGAEPLAPSSTYIVRHAHPYATSARLPWCPNRDGTLCGNL